MSKRFATNQAQRRFEAPDIDTSKAAGLRADHPAVLNGRSIFPKSIVHPDDDERLLVSGHNNPKLGKRVVKGPWKGMPIFHLTFEERATCPSSCRMWQHCYGNAMPFARRNDANTGDRLYVALDHELGVLQRKHPDGFVVRLHTLGDFFSVQYVDAWRGWLADFPALRVFGYTSNNPMAADRAERDIGQAVATLASEQWDRFAIRLSCGEPGAARSVVVDAPDERLLMCPAQTKDSECCATCGLCWLPAAKDKAIGFLRHGMTRTRGPRKPKPDGSIVLQKRPRGRPRKTDRNPLDIRVDKLVAASGMDRARAAQAIQRFSLSRGTT